MTITFTSLSDVQQHDILTEYKNGVSLPKLARKYNLSVGSLGYHVKKAGLSRTASEATKKFSVNDDFFNTIDTQEKAYVLGLWYADGNVHIRQLYKTNADSVRIKDGKQYVGGISLLNTDKLILEQIRDLLCPSWKLWVHQDQRDDGWNRKPMCKLSFCNKRLVLDLIKHGCVPNKTEVGLTIPDLPSHLLRHFIRGYFDGDGSINFTNGKVRKDKAQFSIIGNEEFVEQIGEIIKREVGVTVHTYSHKPNPQMWYLRVYGNQQIKKIMNWLYQNAKLFLPRKNEWS